MEVLCACPLRGWAEIVHFLYIAQIHTVKISLHSCCQVSAFPLKQGAVCFCFFTSGLGLQQDAFTEEKCARVSVTDRTSPWISSAGSRTNHESGVRVCVCVRAFGMALWVVVDPALQQIQSDSRNWMQCDHYSGPPPPYELNPASGVIM